MEQSVIERGCWEWMDMEEECGGQNAGGQRLVVSHTQPVTASFRYQRCLRALQLP